MACLLAVLAAGCAGYRVGPSNGTAAGSKSVEIRLFRDDTMEPRLLEAVGMALRRRVQQDGTYRLSTAGEADIIVTGAITGFDRAGVSFQPRDILTVRDFTLSLVAHVTATERSSGKVLLDRDVTGKSTIRVGADMASAERQAVPLLAEDLARNTVSLLSEGTW